MSAPTSLLHERYRLLRVVDSTPTRTVHEALDSRFGTSVLIHELPPGADEPTRDCFMREVRLLNALYHPSLPYVFDTFALGESHYAVSRNIKADPLGRLLSLRAEPFPVGDVLGWADTALDLLDLLHARNPCVVHCNITPGALRVTARGDLLVCDFNYVVEQPMRAAGYTLPYAPPEQIRGQEVGPATDLYGLAATLYTLLTATQPPSAFERVSGGPATVAAADEINPAVPRHVAEALRGAMSVDEAERPRSARELRSALAAVERRPPAPVEAPVDMFDTKASVIDTGEMTPEFPLPGAGEPTPRTSVICKTCGTANDPRRQFCPHCGAVLRAEERSYEARDRALHESPTRPVEQGAELAKLFPPAAGRVRLLVVEGVEPGITLQVRVPETVLGRSGGDYEFPADPFMSSRHARVIYRGSRFLIQDNNSRNGTFVQVRGETPLRNGDIFLVGSQLLRFESGAKRSSAHVRVVFQDGTTGERFVLDPVETAIGRTYGAIRFPDDLSMADSHARIVFRDDGPVLVDDGSQAGTFIRVSTETELHDGDLLIVGQHLFRFENDEESHP